MLSPHEISAGTLGDASPIALMLPRTKYEYAFLIGTLEDEPFAVCLSESGRFRGFTSSGNRAHSGLIVPNVSLEIDEATAFDPVRAYAPDGAIIRHEERLSLACSSESGFSRGTTLVTLLTGLPRSAAQVGFTRWSVTVGEGLGKRSLLHVDSTPQA